MAKTPETPKSLPPVIKRDSSFAIAALVLGILSIVGFGFLLGIPAIILATIALKNKTPNQSLSLAGLITGIIGTALSILVVLFFILMLFLGSNQSNNQAPYQYGSNPFDNGAPQQFYNSGT